MARLTAIPISVSLSAPAEPIYGTNLDVLDSFGTIGDGYAAATADFTSNSGRAGVGSLSAS